MNHLIKDIFDSICELDILNIFDREEPTEYTEAIAENVSVIYSNNIGVKGYHLFDFNGKQIKYNSEAYKLEQAKEIVHENICVALTKGSAIYLLFDVSELSQPFLEFILKQVFLSAIQFAQEKRTHRFKVAFANAVDNKVKEYKRNIEQNEDDAEEKEEELLELRRKVVADKYAMQVIDGTVGQWKQKAEAEYDRIMKLIPNLYKLIELDGEDLYAHTHYVEITHKRQTYEIGEFEVRINLSTGNLKISNLTKRLDDTYDHPHIIDGSSCLGNIGKGIIKMLAEFELFGVLQLVHSFLHSYNPNSPYKKIEFWDPDYEDEEEDRYETCHEGSYGYTCVECGDRECPFYDQAYDDCFENSELDDCINCEYQCNLGRERIRRHNEEERQHHEEQH